MWKNWIIEIKIKVSKKSLSYDKTRSWYWQNKWTVETMDSRDYYEQSTLLVFQIPVFVKLYMCEALLASDGFQQDQTDINGQ